MVIEGAISIKAALQSGKRDINKVYIDKNKKTKDFNYIRRLLKEKHVLSVETTREELEKITDSRTFGGILADVSERRSDEFTDGDVFVVDGVEDPFNLGYIARSLYAFGIKNLVLPGRDYSFMESQILKSSAGASEYMNVIYAEDMVECVKGLKKDYRIYGLKRDDTSKDIFDTVFHDKSCFLLGGEKRGLSGGLEELCDEYLYISYGSDFRNALNACSACATVATLLYRQKRK